MLAVSLVTSVQASMQFKHFPGYKANYRKRLGRLYVAARDGTVGKLTFDPTLSGAPQPRLDCAPGVILAGIVGSTLQTRSVQLFEDWLSGDLWAFHPKSGGLNGGTCALIQASAVPSVGYYGMAIAGPYGLYDYVALLNYYGTGWLCLYTNGGGANDFGVCAATETIGPPASFCLSQPAGVCNPDGQAFDPSGNLWYVDYFNGDEVELLSECGWTCVGTVNYYPATFYGSLPAPVVGLYIDSSDNHWAVAEDCSGTLYYNLVAVYAVLDDVEAVTISAANHYHTNNVYVAVDNFCGTYPYAFIGDLSTGFILPHPYANGSSDFEGICNLLSFSDSSFALPLDKVWTTYE